MPHLVVVLDIDDGLLELSRRDLAVEQNVQLAITPTLEFRQAKKCASETDSSSATPDISALACKIPTSRVQHLTGQVNHRNLRNVVRSATDSSGQSPQPHGARFGDDGVGDWTESSGVHEGDEDSEDRLRVVRSVVLRDRGADAEEHQECAVCGSAVEENIAAAEVGAKGNRENCGDELEAGVDEAELEGEICLFKVSQY